MFTYPIDCIMKWDGIEVSDHNRGPLSVSYEKFTTDHRMIEGTLRRLTRGRDKRTFKVDWKDLFSDTHTVDGFMGYESIKSAYESLPGDFILSVTSGSGDVEEYRVMFQDFSYAISKRTNATDFYDISVTMVEV